MRTRSRRLYVDMDAQTTPDHAVAALAGRQGGVVSRGQLLRLGLTPGRIRHRVRAGRLHVHHRGVYAVGHPVVRVEGRRWAAVLAAGAGAVLSHGDAAAAWGLREDRGDRVDVTTPCRNGRAEQTGIRLHRVARLRTHEVTRLAGLPITTPARTVLDLAARLRDRQLEQVIDRAELLRLFDLRDLQRAVADHPRRSGTPRLASILEDYTGQATRSELEDAFLALCDTRGLPRPVTNVRLLGHEVDAHWPQTPLIVELDGYAYHRARSAFEGDRARDVDLLLAGYSVLRFTQRQVAHEPARVAAAVERLLGRRERPLHVAAPRP